jgi:hypothetical protein
MNKKAFFIFAVILSLFEHFRVKETKESIVFLDYWPRPRGYTFLLLPNETEEITAVKVAGADKNFKIFYDVRPGNKMWAKVKARKNYYGQIAYSLLELHLSAAEQISSLGR